MRTMRLLLMAVLLSFGFAVQAKAAVVQDPDCIRQCEQTWTPIVEFWITHAATLERQLPAKEAAVARAQEAIDAAVAESGTNRAAIEAQLLIALRACLLAIEPPAIAACNAAAAASAAVALIQEGIRYTRVIGPLTQAYDEAVVARFALQTQISAANDQAIAAARSRVECKLACPYVER